MKTRKDNQSKTFKLSTSSDAHHTHKTILLGLGAILLLMIGSGWGYSFGARTQEISSDPTPFIALAPPTETPSSVPTVNLEAKYEIKNKDVYEILNGSKENIGRVYEIRPSPDKSKNAILVEGMISSLALFISIEGKNELNYIAPIEEVKWSNNSRYVVCTVKVSDAGSTYKLTVFDTKTNKSISINEKVDKSIIANPNRTSYHNPQWLSDDSGIIVDYIEYDNIPSGAITSKGTTTVLIKAQ